jgi:hypothetical protein
MKVWGLFQVSLTEQFGQYLSCPIGDPMNKIALVKPQIATRVPDTLLLKEGTEALGRAEPAAPDKAPAPVTVTQKPARSRPPQPGARAAGA